jgi:hypothetical protein
MKHGAWHPFAERRFSLRVEPIVRHCRGLMSNRLNARTPVPSGVGVQSFSF